MKLLTYLRDAAIFAPCYLLLDWVSYIHPLGPFNITPWNPQPALAIAWMVLAGLEHAPAVLAAIFLADVLIRGTPAGLEVTALSAAVLALGYAAIAFTLRRLLGPRPGLHSLRELTEFSAAVLVGTALVGAAFIALLYGTGALGSASAVAAWVRFWTGDAVGVLVTGPLLLVAADADRRGRLRLLAGRPATYVQACIVAATLWLIFRGLGGDPAHHFYLLFLPLIWIAIASGMPGVIVAVAVVQVGVVLGIQNPPGETLPVIELQALVAALTLTGLYLGLVVDERSRAAEELKQSLRLAAAGEMAGAIAHEVNQPLTALTNYARSGQLLLQAGRSGELAPVLERVLAEAQRASEVVRRLRDFFRQGTTRFERVSVLALLEDARRARTSIEVNVESPLPEVLIDRLQMELVLRNLLSNALEAGGGKAALSARREDAEHVRIVVADSGPGIPEADTERVFQPFVSGKPSGMGLGLAVSRAIVEAHGGTLQSRPAAHGELHIVLPIDASHG